jgi:hypothetical protein
MYISEHIQRALGKLAVSRTERGARDVVANTNAGQTTGLVERRNTGEVINDNSAHIEMCAEYLPNQVDENGIPRASRARRRLQDVAGATNTKNAPRAHQTNECVAR